MKQLREVDLEGRHLCFTDRHWWWALPIPQSDCHLALLCKPRGMLTVFTGQLGSLAVSSPLVLPSAAQFTDPRLQPALLRTGQSDSVRYSRLGEASGPRASLDIPLTKHFFKQTTCITQEVAHEIS